MSQLSETFPTLDCSQCILTPRMVEVAQHPNITLYTYAELESVEGFIGNFKVKIRKKSKSLDEKLCTGCGLCTTKCPQKKIPNEFEQGMGMRPAIYVPFPQAVPNKPVIDREHCTYYIKGKCKVCEIVCPTKAIRFDQQDEIVEVEIGAIVIATGFDVKHADFFPEYGYGKYKDVITGLQFERLASASGPTSGNIRDLQTERSLKKLYLLPVPDRAIRQKEFRIVPKYAACIPQNMLCCISIKFMEENPMFSIWISGQEVRSTRNLSEGQLKMIDVNYIRGRVSRIYEKNGKLIVKGVDTLLEAMPVEIEADMVVLATAGVANEGAEELAQKLHVSYDSS